MLCCFLRGRLPEANAGHGAGPENRVQPETVAPSIIEKEK